MEGSSMALSNDRQTPAREGVLLVLPVAASMTCYAGGIAVLDGGYARPGRVSTTDVAIGRFDQTVDNSAGLAGDKTVTVSRGKAYQWKNSGTDALDQSHVGGPCYVEDDETVCATATGKIQAGRVLDIDTSGVWVLMD
jgi:hypothetical protein